MIRDKQLIELFIKRANTDFFRIKVELKFLAAYISCLNFSQEDELEILNILKLIGGSEILIDFGDQSEEIQATVSNQYVINKLFEGIQKNPQPITEEIKHSQDWVGEAEDLQFEDYNKQWDERKQRIDTSNHHETFSEKSVVFRNKY